LWRLAVFAAGLTLLWVIAFLGLAFFGDGCGLEYVLPWYDDHYNILRSSQ